MTDDHKIDMFAGRYRCSNEDCDFDTMNRWSAEAHYIEENGLDPENVRTDAPDEFFE